MNSFRNTGLRFPAIRPGAAKAAAFRALAGTALCAVLALAAACRPAPVPEVATRPADPPAEFSSVGDLGVYVETEALEERTGRLTVPLAAEQAAWYQPESLRLALWLPGERRFEILADSRYDAGVLRAEISRSGTYGVFGLSRLPHAHDFQRRLCAGELARPGGSEFGFIPRICTVILCPALDARAWSAAFRDHTGLPVEPGAMREHFGNLCDQCLGRPGDIRPPECGIDVTEPATPVEPPALEQMPIRIPWGGRAVAIGVDPSDDDNMVVASETGGLFRTTDGGDTWVQTSRAATFDFSDVQHLPGDPDVVIASAKRDTRVDSGGGLWRSTDGGGSWSQVAVTPPVAGCADDFAAYALDHEADRDRLWAGTECGVAFSEDGGVTWNYLSAVAGYNHDKTYAVLAPAEGHLKILTGSGVKVTEDDGASWQRSNTGLPGNIFSRRVHNQIALSPRDHTHIFWAFNFWRYDSEADKWRRRHALYLSTDNGASWSEVLDRGGSNRPVFMRVSEQSLSEESDAYDVYYGNGGCWFARATATHGAIPTFSEWTPLSVDHCDASDLAFRSDGKTPWLLASDGGLHETDDDGATWTTTGAGEDGYNALQITEVTGQLHDTGTGSDLYFGTQDNDIWASPSTGAEWTERRCCEGFHLNIPRRPLPVDETTLTGVSCGPCMNFMSGPVLASEQAWPNPPNDAGNPRLLKPGAYNHNTKLPGVDANLFNVTTNTGSSWTPSYGFPEPVKALSEVAGPEDDPTVFTAYKRPGTTPAGAEQLGIKRVTGVLVGGTPVVSEVPDVSGLGTFPTMFAWYKPYGVDPDDPNFLIVPDIVDDVVQKTTDGGMTWEPDNGLTDLVTDSGTFRFSWGQFGQVSNIAFDPECDGHILVGTRQAGIFRSFDRGENWHKIPGTEVIPRVSRFYFRGQGEAIASSYGRGLWRLRYDCPGAARPTIPVIPFPRPVVYLRGVLVPLADIDPDSCPKCRYLLVQDGAIQGVRTDSEGRVAEVLVSDGRLQGYTAGGEPVEFPVQATPSEQGPTFDDKELTQLLAEGTRVRGLFLEERRVKGFIVAAQDVAPEQLPRERVVGPYITLNLPTTYGVPVADLDRIVVTGHGFDPDYPIEITVDGEPFQPDDEPRFDEEGRFRVELRPLLEIGGHTLRVRQETDDGVIEDVYTFNVTVKDEPPDEERKEQQPDSAR